MAVGSVVGREGQRGAAGLDGEEVLWTGVGVMLNGAASPFHVLWKELK